MKTFVFGPLPMFLYFYLFKGILVKISIRLGLGSKYKTHSFQLEKSIHFAAGRGMGGVGMIIYIPFIILKNKIFLEKY